MTSQPKVALVVEGGAMRGIFPAGILDAFIKENFNPFDLCIGVSAGANNLASYLAGKYKRNYTVYTDYFLRKETISWKKYLKGGHLLDLDWLWDISLKELPIDKNRIINAKSNFYVGVTDVKTGEVLYIKPNEQNLEDVLKASSCMPLVYRHFIKIEDKEYADGGIADPIPVKEAINQGAKLIVVLRTRPYSYPLKIKKHILYRFMFRKYPNLRNSLYNRPHNYQNTLDFMRNHKDVKIIEVNPPETFQTERFTKDKEILERDYESGYQIGLDLVRQINRYL